MIYTKSQVFSDSTDRWSGAECGRLQTLEKTATFRFHKQNQNSHPCTPFLGHGRGRGRAKAKVLFRPPVIDRNLLMPLRHLSSLSVDLRNRLLFLRRTPYFSLFKAPSLPLCRSVCLLVLIMSILRPYSPEQSPSAFTVTL